MSDQETIAKLNQRTADYDVEIERLNGLLADMQHHIDALAEAKANLTKANETIEKLTAENQKMLADGNALFANSQALAKQVQNLQAENGKLSTLYTAQNNYVIALEHQACDEVARTLSDLSKAQLELQIVQLQARLAF